MPRLRILLLAGQSNMEGSGAISQLRPDQARVPSNVRLFERGLFRTLAWRPRFGPEIGLAQAWAERRPTEPLVLCKVARDSSNLHYDWNPQRLAGGPEDEYRGPLYVELLDQYRALRRQLDATGESAEPAGLLWMQGERDSVFPFMAENYQTAMVDLIRRLRQDVGAPHLPVVVGRIAPRAVDPASGRLRHPYSDRVQAAQDALPGTTEHVAVVETADLPQSDDLHFTTEGQLELGRRFAATLDQLLARADVVTSPPHCPTS